MPPPAQSTPSRVLADLARTKGVATEYDDWQGNHVVVPAGTIVAVLRALGIDAADEASAARALAAEADRPWRRLLPPVVVCREGWTPWVPVHLPHGDHAEVLGRARDRRPSRGAPGRPLGAAAQHRRARGGRGDVRAARRPAARLALAGGQAPRHHRDRTARGDPLQAAAARVAGRPPRVGADDPAVLGALAALVGRRRPRRPRRDGLVGCARPRRRLRPGQPAARRRAGSPDGAVALPAHDPAVRQPDVHPGRGHPRDGLRLRGRAPAAGVARGRRARA